MEDNHCIEELKIDYPGKPWDTLSRGKVLRKTVQEGHILCEVQVPVKSVTIKVRMPLTAPGPSDLAVIDSIQELLED